MMTNRQTNKQTEKQTESLQHNSAKTCKYKKRIKGQNYESKYIEILNIKIFIG